MGEVANDMVRGLCCSTCGIYFQREHGYPVLCNPCWDDTTQEERDEMGVQRAKEREL